ncbi:MAG: dienelactone hydrolase family protein [Candidatus Sericytochromatia bacterium]|nr:dienelactone hydrolase family protein [Candidatus Sericytochromatia bacterium]
MEPTTCPQELTIPATAVRLAGALTLPSGAQGLVLFAHGSGSSRQSPRNRYVAEVLGRAGLGTLLFDLLTPTEEQEDAVTAAWRFDIGLLARRLVEVTDWVGQLPTCRGLPLGYFGASTGAAAALIAAAERPACVWAVVSRGGRPDLAGPALAEVQAPTLLLVGGEDPTVLSLNREAAAQLRAPVELVIVPGATHLFEEPGTLEAVAKAAAAFFERHLGRRGRP